MRQEQDRKGGIIKESLYPFLVQNSISVESAKTFLSVIALVINQKFLNKMKDIKISDLDLESELKEDSPEEAKYRAFLSTFKDQDIRTMIDVLEATGKIIDNAIKIETGKKKLEEINIPYITNEKDN